MRTRTLAERMRAGRRELDRQINVPQSDLSAEVRRLSVENEALREQIAGGGASSADGAEAAAIAMAKRLGLTDDDLALAEQVESVHFGSNTFKLRDGRQIAIVDQAQFADRGRR